MLRPLIAVVIVLVSVIDKHTRTRTPANGFSDGIAILAIYLCFIIIMFDHCYARYVTISAYKMRHYAIISNLIFGTDRNRRRTRRI
jgi:hypothetical protein